MYPSFHINRRVQLYFIADLFPGLVIPRSGTFTIRNLTLNFHLEIFPSPLTTWIFLIFFSLDARFFFGLTRRTGQQSRIKPFENNLSFAGGTDSRLTTR